MWGHNLRLASHQPTLDGLAAPRHGQGRPTLEAEEIYQACGKELLALILVTATSPECWVDVPPLVAHAQLLVDTHNSLGHCGWDKLL